MIVRETLCRWPVPWGWWGRALPSHSCSVPSLNTKYPLEVAIFAQTTYWIMETH